MMPRSAQLQRSKSDQNGYHAVPGSEIAPLPGAYVVSPANPTRRIELTLLLRSRPRPADDRVVSTDEVGAVLPRDRVYLSREAVARLQGADPADVEEVVRFASNHGLLVVGQNLGARTVYLSGTISDLSRAFRTTLAVYRYAGGTYRGRTGAVHVPPVLRSIVHGVFGFDNRPVAKAHFRVKQPSPGVWANAQSVSYTPQEVAALYNFPPTADGTGQCIGIIELDGGFKRTDLVQYFTGLGIPTPKVAVVRVNGGKNHPTGDPNGPDVEVMLDIEVAGAVAPGAKIVVYFAPNTDQGFLRAITRAIHDKVHQPSVISISWGMAESFWTRQSLNAFNQAFQTASLLGVTVCVAAGDNGSSDGVAGRRANVDFPASSPYVLGCGGTTLEASDGVVTAEYVWNDGVQGGGGGGVSEFFPLPSWQKKAGVPASVNPGGRVGRGVPDLSGNADFNTGYRVRVDGINVTVGGTSAVAPLTSGLTALLNQELGTSIGYANPLLYTVLDQAGAFRDITKGNNDLSGLVGGYDAGPGWDAASGLGSPDGNVMLAALTAPKKHDARSERHTAAQAASKHPRKARTHARKKRGI